MLTSSRCLFKAVPKVAPAVNVLRHHLSTSQTFLCPAQVVESPYGELNFTPKSISNAVWENLEKWSNRTALVCGQTGRSYNYSQLYQMSRCFGASLLKRGFQPGDVISLVLPNIPEFAISILGAFDSGLVVSTINPIYTPGEIRHQLSDSGSKCVITFPQKVPEVTAAINEMPSSQRPKAIIVIQPPQEALPKGAWSFFELVAAGKSDLSLLDSVKCDPSSVTLLLYSSGTTGLPKGVRLTHNNIVANTQQINHPCTKLVHDTTKSHQDVIPTILPMFHVYGLSVGLINYLIAGCKIVTLPKFEPQMFLSAIKDHKGNVLHLVPPLIQFLAHHPSVKAEHLDSVRAIANGAAAVSEADVLKLMEKKKHLMISGYGLTESSPVITSPSNQNTDLKTVGFPMQSTTVKIVDTETGELIDPTTPGEICCKGPQVMEGYHNNEKATKDTLKDGWLHTGDVGFFRDGQLYIVDRMKELIKVKGFQVAPLELEDLLKHHAGVVDVAVVGKPDPRFGEVPVAFVVPNPQKTPSEEELKEFVASSLSEYKHLSQVIFTKAIPKNSTGKIMRNSLRESLAKL